MLFDLGLQWQETIEAAIEPRVVDLACFDVQQIVQRGGIPVLFQPHADPHLRWCGRGGRVTVPPMPIFAAASRDDMKAVKCLPLAAFDTMFSRFFGRRLAVFLRPMIRVSCGVALECGGIFSRKLLLK